MRRSDFVVGKTVYLMRPPWYARLRDWLFRRRTRLVVTKVDYEAGEITVEAQP